MRRVVSIVPASVCTFLALLGGCASSNERTVYVPATTSGALIAGDPLGMQLMQKAGIVSQSGVVEHAYTQASSRSHSAEPASFTTFAQSPSAPVVAAAQGGFVTMMSSYPSYGRLRDSEVRMPIVTFAATDGPSAD